MPKSVNYKITSCKKCPECKVENDYTADSFERPERWDCKLMNKNIERYIGWTSSEQNSIKIPDWCPLIKKIKKK